MSVKVSLQNLVFRHHYGPKHMYQFIQKGVDQLTVRVYDLSRVCIFRKQISDPALGAVGSVRELMRKCTEIQLLPEDIVDLEIQPLQAADCTAALECAIRLISKACGDPPRQLTCPISMDLFEDPITMGCGHVYERNEIAKWAKAGGIECPECRVTTHHKVTDIGTSVLIRDQVNEYLAAIIPTFSTFGSSDPGQASRWMTRARQAVAEGDVEFALDNFKKAFRYTNSPDDYAEMVQILQERGDQVEAALSACYLTKYLVAAGRIDEAIAVLRKIASREVVVGQAFLRLLLLAERYDEVLSYIQERGGDMNSTFLAGIFEHLVVSDSWKSEYYLMGVEYQQSSSEKVHFLLRGVYRAISKGEAGAGKILYDAAKAYDTEEELAPWLGLQIEEFLGAHSRVEALRQALLSRYIKSVPADDAGKPHQPVEPSAPPLWLLDTNVRPLSLNASPQELLTEAKNLADETAARFDQSMRYLASEASAKGLVGVASLCEAERLRAAEARLKRSSACALSEEGMIEPGGAVLSSAPLEELVVKPGKEGPAVAPVGQMPVQPSAPPLNVLEAPPVPRMAFGSDEWNMYFGSVGHVPPLPSNISEILRSECPFNPGQLVDETHLLVLIPSTVDEVPFSLARMAYLIERTKGRARKTKYFPWEKVRQLLGRQAPRESYWALITRDFIPGSKGFSLKKGRELAEARGYQLPKAIEVVTGILTEFVHSGRCLCAKGPRQSSWSRCDDRLGQSMVAVGNFSPDGISVTPDRHSPQTIGSMAILRLTSVANLYDEPKLPSAPKDLVSAKKETAARSTASSASHAVTKRSKPINQHTLRIFKLLQLPEVLQDQDLYEALSGEQLLLMRLDSEEADFLAHKKVLYEHLHTPLVADGEIDLKARNQIISGYNEFMEKVSPDVCPRLTTPIRALESSLDILRQSRSRTDRSQAAVLGREFVDRTLIGINWDLSKDFTAAWSDLFKHQEGNNLCRYIEDNQARKVAETDIYFSPWLGKPYARYTSTSQYWAGLRQRYFEAVLRACDERYSEHPRLRHLVQALQTLPSIQIPAMTIAEALMPYGYCIESKGKPKVCVTDLGDNAFIHSIDSEYCLKDARMDLVIGDLGVSFIMKVKVVGGQFEFDCRCALKSALTLFRK